MLTAMPWCQPLNYYQAIISAVRVKEWKKEQASCCCTAYVCLGQSVNQLYNNQKMAKVVLFSIAWLESP